MKATTTLVLYTEQKIIAEVYEGESYLVPEDVMVFEGDLEAFKIVHPNISEQEENNGAPSGTGLTAKSNLITKGFNVLTN